MVQQKIYQGYDSHQKLNALLQEFRPKKIFFVTGNNSYVSSKAKDILEPVLKEYAYFQHSDFEINVKVHDLQKSIDLFKSEKCDLVIGIGGGTVLDMAKAVAILVDQDKDAENSVLDMKNVIPRNIPLILMPTTAGTGSEATHFSVVYIDKTKYSLAHPSMLPDAAIVDPVFTLNLPPYITACTALDALAQAIESFWAVSSTDESRKFSAQAIPLLMDHIEKCVNQPDEDVREKVLWASHLAGKAVNIAKTTAAHAVSYPMTSFFNIAHGHAVALTLPSFLVFNSQVDESNIQDPRGVSYVRENIKELCALLKVQSAEKAKEKITTLMKNINLETRLSKLGIKQDDLQTIVKNGTNPERTKNNPRKITEAGILTMLEGIL